MNQSKIDSASKVQREPEREPSKDPTNIEEEKFG